jgi:monofunctional biosynthetic peptidoglycan transglycosylase
MGRARRRSRRWLLIAVATGVCVMAAVLFWQAWRWPDIGALASRNPASTAFIDQYRARERAAGRSSQVAWKWVAYSSISPNLKRAVVVAEDIGFFSHRGFEPAELRNAVERALEDGTMPRGASTITQQLAKNLWLSPSRNPVRKVKEVVLTWQLEHHLTKRRILELYLNVAEFGPGVYGAEAAGRRYFGKSAADLNEDEAAQLAAGLPNPRVWHPGAPGPGYRRYVDTIKRRMAKADLRRSDLP